MKLKMTMLLIRTDSCEVMKQRCEMNYKIKALHRVTLRIWRTQEGRRNKFPFSLEQLQEGKTFQGISRCSLWSRGDEDDV